MRIPLTPQAIRESIGIIITNITSIAGVAGQEAMADSFPVVIASDQSDVDMAIASIADVDGQATMAASLPVVIASDQTQIPVDDGWVVLTISDLTADDSDKNWVTPADVIRQILGIWVEYTSTATAGNRQIVVEIQIAGPDTTAQWARAGVTQAASLTYYYEFAPGLADLTALRDTDYLTTPIPVTSLLKEADVLRVYDNNAVAVAADDMIVHIQYADRSLV